ncbi:MAG: SctF chaperone SctG [Verrucomicrobia bacterium]|nr:SctF chaperone SctG [Verrucomicrobiota bacterium]
MNWKHYKDDFFLFVEAGYIAVNQADEDAAMKLFRAAEMLNPEHSLPKIGFGYLHLHKLELKQACKCFDEVLAEQPDNEMAKAFLGIAMSMTPTQVSEGEKLLEQSTKSKDPLIKRLGASALDFVEKFVKKTPGPVVAEKPKKKKSR